MSEENETVSLNDYDFGSNEFGFDANEFYESPDDRFNEYLGYDESGFTGWGDAPGTSGSATTIDSSSGNITYKYDDGSSLTVGPDGMPVGNTESPDAQGNSVAFNRALAWASSNLGPTAAKVLANVMKNPGASLLTAIAAAKAFGGSDQQGGYNKPVPKMDMVREQVQYNDPNRAPGSTGRQYLTNPLFVAKDDTENAAKALEATRAQASGLQAAMQAAPAPAPNPYAGKMNLSYAQQRPAPVSGAGLPQIPTQLNAQGGIPMASGGLADAGRYLQGKTDGMADKIETSIDGEQPALLSHGEFVIPADVVSHLGNGNSEAGAEKLYAMMDKIREARTGTTEQGKEINADKFLAAASGGLMAAYAGGGEVQRFQGGGTPNTPANVPPTGGGVPLDTSRTSTLSPWVGDYVTNALGQGAALANAPYQAYKGPLTAGASNLQQQAFTGASEMAQAGYQPGQFTGSFTPQIAQQYMNPYLQASLDPQLKEMQRQSDIARLADTSRLTKAGAYGGSRQAIMESEGRRNLLDKQQDVLGTGYKTAYDMAQQQYAKERGDEEASRQFGANFGMKSIDQLANLGTTERGITSEGLAADKAQFEEQRDFAYKMPQYQLNLLQGLPIGANTTSSDQTGLAKIQSDISGLGALYKSLEKLGQTTPAPTQAPTQAPG
jgi:hypothetical protein